MENTKNNPNSSSNSGGRSEKVTSNSSAPTVNNGQQQPQGKGSKLKRAFSMPRNPFQSVSRQTTGRKTVVEKSGTGTMTNASVVTSEQNSINSGGGGVLGVGGGGGGRVGTDATKVQGPEANRGEKKIFRRLSVKKFINRIAQQMTYVSLAVSAEGPLKMEKFVCLWVLI